MSLCQRVALAQLLLVKGRETVLPGACEQGIDPGVVPVVGVHHIYILETVEIERLLRKSADKSRLEERRPHVLEESFRSAFICLQKPYHQGTSHPEDTRSLCLQTKIHQLSVI